MSAVIHHNDEIQYTNQKTQFLSDKVLTECAKLFSSNYGNYSEYSDIRPGQNVRLSASYYKNHYCTPDFSVALARKAGRIIGQAFYIRKSYKNIGIMTWVVQLVVDKNYRQRGIASTLLRSIWGFSDDYAWGLATANPCTVKTLEAATFRECRSEIIVDHIDDIEMISMDIGFAKEGVIEISADSSQINSHFSVDNSGYSGIDECELKLGKLKPGREWIAFVFQDQKVDVDRYKRSFNELIDFSEMQLKEAYSRMNMESHAWAKGSSAEIDFILGKIHINDHSTAVDLGCGIGRHSIEMARRGLKVLSYDYSETNIIKAKKNATEQGIDGCSFYCADIRELKETNYADLVISLYDVIGSYPSQADNIKIIQKAYEILAPDGYFVASVMNMELTEHLVPESQKGILSEDPEILLDLKPGNIMQSTGDIFNPEYLAIDTRDGLVYRKEQFGEDEMLPAEFVIRDKRYRMNEIIDLVKNVGFYIEDCRFVRAGHFDEPLGPTDPHAKEIVLIAKKQ